MTHTVCLDALLILLLAWTPGKPQAPVTSDSKWIVKVAGRDQPQIKGTNCHPLEYFTDGSHLKDFDYVHHIPKPYPEGISDEVESKRRGEIDGFAVYDVIHHVDASEAPADWEHFSYPPGLIKMVLVERKPGEFCEIFHEQDSDGEFTASPSYFVDLGSERVLAAHDRISGNGGYFNEAYWTFDKDGPIPLGINIIKETVEKLLPANMHVDRGVGFEIETLSYDTGLIQDPANGECCGSRRGAVHLEFALTDHKLVLINQKFDPEGFSVVRNASQKTPHIFVQAGPGEIKTQALAMFEPEDYSIDSETASELKISRPLSSEEAARLTQPGIICRRLRSLLLSNADQGTSVAMTEETVCHRGHSSVIMPSHGEQQIESMQNDLTELKTRTEQVDQRP